MPRECRGYPAPVATLDSCRIPAALAATHPTPDIDITAAYLSAPARTGVPDAITLLQHATGGGENRDTSSSDDSGLPDDAAPLRRVDSASEDSSLGSPPPLQRNDMSSSSDDSSAGDASPGSSGTPATLIEVHSDSSPDGPGFAGEVFNHSCRRRTPH